MLAKFDGTCTEHQPNKNKEVINNRNNKENTSNIEQISEKKSNGRTNHGLTVLLRTIKDQTKQKIHNGITRGRTYRTYNDHLWITHTSVT